MLFRGLKVFLDVHINSFNNLGVDNLTHVIGTWVVYLRFAYLPLHNILLAVSLNCRHATAELLLACLFNGNTWHFHTLLLLLLSFWPWISEDYRELPNVIPINNCTAGSSGERTS